jgi:uncharacterized protein
LSPTADLLDASVWVALAARDHAHHARAMRFWQEERQGETAFCRISALAFVRLMMNPAVMLYGTLSASEAWEQYQEWRRVPGVIFLHEPAGLEAALGELLRTGGLGHRAVTDAYLAAFAGSSGCRFVSFDQGFRRFQHVDRLLLTP